MVMCKGIFFLLVLWRGGGVLRSLKCLLRYFGSVWLAELLGSVRLATHHPFNALDLRALKPVCIHCAGDMAYLTVHSRAILLKPARSFLNFFAISGTSGSSGLGSVRSEQMESKTLEMVSAGLHRGRARGGEEGERGEGE